MNDAIARIWLLGEPKVADAAGNALSFPTQKSVAALAMIISVGDNGIRRQTICERLWSRSPEAQARTNLRQALSGLRKILGAVAQNMTSDGDVLRFAREDVWLDINVLNATPSELDERDLVILLQAGEFLEGVSLNEPDFEDWLRAERAEYHRKLTDFMEREAHSRIASGDFQTAERIARKLISLDNFHEAAHRLRMRALEGSGEIATALKHHEELVVLFRSELGVSPGSQTNDLALSLREAASRNPPDWPQHRQDNGVAQAAVKKPDTFAGQELRNVAVLAVDISENAGSTGIENEFEHVQEMSNALTTLIQDQGGTPVSNTGNSLLAVFGYPVAHSRDGERSLRCAEKTLLRIRELAPKANARAAVVSGIVLTNTAENQGVLGDPIRRAQSLLHKTPLAGICVDRGIFNATGKIAAYEALGADFWCVSSLREQAQQGKVSGFLGRDRELRQAVDLLRDIAEARSGEVLVLRGEAGIGKTRLSAEIAEVAKETGFRVATCRVFDFGQGRADEALTTLTKILSDDLTLDLNRMERSVWADLTGAELGETDRQLIRELDPNSLNAERSRLLCKLTDITSERAPFLLTVEDVHWADNALLQLLGDLASCIGSNPVALLLTTRPESDPLDNSWRLRAGNTQITTIDLQALKQPAALTLAKNICALDDDLLEQCLERAGGNPLFIEQLVLWADEQSDTSLPLSVQSVVQERLDKLPQRTRRMVQAASVLGQVFDARALEAVLGESIGREAQLDGTHLILQRDDRLNFVHALVREGAYASIPPRERRDLHHRAAEWFAASDHALSARHCYWSESKSASETCFLAATKEYEERRLDTALELARLALERCDSPKAYQKILLLVAEVLRDLERFSEAIDVFDKIDPQDPTDILRVNIGAAESYFRIDDHDSVLRLIGEAATVDLAREDPFWRATISCMKSGVEFARGKSELSIQHAQEATEAANSSSDIGLRARALSTLADAEMSSGLFQSSERHFRECVDLCRGTGRHRYELSNQTIVAMLRFYDAETHECHRIMTETVAEARAINFARAQMNGEHMLAYVRNAAGDHDAAVKHWRRARDIIEATSAKRFLMNSGCYAAMSFGPLGDVENALRYLSEAEQMASDLNMVWVLPWVLASRARWDRNMDVRRDALGRAEDLIFSGQASYPFEFYYVGIDAALDMEDWLRVENYAQRLETYVAREPVGLPTYVAARARAISAAAQGRGSVTEIRALMDFAQRNGLLESMAWLDRALERCPGST